MACEKCKNTHLMLIEAERMRDFITWLCDNKLSESETELWKEFDEWEEQNELKEKTNSDG